MNTPFDNAQVLVVATSLNAGSRSAVLAREAYGQLRAQGIAAELVDLRELDLPFATGGGEHDSHPGVVKIREAFKRATHILMAVPIYNGDVNSAARNLANLGCKFYRKTVGFLCASGGEKSFMAVYAFANSLMWEFSVWIAPDYVFATGSDFAGDTVSNPDLRARIGKLNEQVLTRGGAVRSNPQPAAA